MSEPQVVVVNLTGGEGGNTQSPFASFAVGTVCANPSIFLSPHFNRL